jgi:hypothetical protein
MIANNALVAWAPALVAGAFALLVSAAAALFAAVSQRRLAEDFASANTVRDQRLLALERETIRDSAVRSYEYEARKRLYAELRPLMFQLREYCIPATERIRLILTGDIVVTSRDVLSSMHRICCPLVNLREIERRVLDVDVALEPALRAQYAVACELELNLHAGRALAATLPAIEDYWPDNGPAHRQHLTHAEVEGLEELLTGPAGRPLRHSELACDGRLDPAVRLFEGASPATTPVLWRLLLAQAALMNVLVEMVDQNTSWPRALLPGDIDRYGWAGSPDFPAEKGAVERYVWDRLRQLAVLA